MAARKIEQLFVEAGEVKDMRGKKVEARPLLVDTLRRQNEGKCSLETAAAERAPRFKSITHPIGYAVGPYRYFDNKKRAVVGVIYFEIISREG